MNYTEVIINGILLGLAVAISVGPTLFAVIRYSMHHTYKAGLAFVIGVSISDILYVLIANTATETWRDTLKFYEQKIGLIGAILFMVMGLYLFFKKYKPQRPKRGEAITISQSTYLKIFASGFFMNTLNPAVMLIWLGASLKIAAYTLLEKILFFAVCLILVLSIDFCKVFLAEKIKSWLTLRKILYLNKASALIIFLFGALIFYNFLSGTTMTH